MAIKVHISMVIFMYMQALMKQTSMSEVQYLDAGLIYVVFIPGKSSIEQGCTSNGI
jgi:hypothetical protein